MSADPVTGVADAVTMLLSVVGKVMDKLPNYDQRKKEEFYKLRTKYENEKSKEYYMRDDNQLGIYRDRVMRFCSIFSTELSK